VRNGTLHGVLVLGGGGTPGGGETERVRRYAAEAAAALANAETLREARRTIEARGEYLGIVSHDLRTPLSSIMMSAALLLEAELPAELARRQLEAIVRSAGYIERLVHVFLDLSRLEAGRLRLDLRPSAPAALVAAAASAFEPLAREREITVSASCAADLPRVAADPDRVMQVFSNLLTNALEASARGDTIHLGAEPAGESVRFYVWDTGDGIAPGDLPHVFDRYWQASKTHHAGVGLGLAIAKGAVEAHHGTIEVESRLGEGTTFTFTLPAEAPAAPLADAPAVSGTTRVPGP
jgi:signal transduction histidine kinase